MHGSIMFCSSSMHATVLDTLHVILLAWYSQRADIHVMFCLQRSAHTPPQPCRDLRTGEASPISPTAPKVHSNRHV